jgi:hypothetical protein
MSWATPMRWPAHAPCSPPSDRGGPTSPRDGRRTGQWADGSVGGAGLEDSDSDTYLLHIAALLRRVAGHHEHLADATHS